MINRVLVFGRLIDDPQPTTTPGGTPLTILRLEVRHPRWNDEVPDVCTVEVHALGERRGEVLTRYLRKGEDLMVEGQLRDHEGSTCVTLDRFHFVGRNNQTRYYWVEAYRQTQEAA